MVKGNVDWHLVGAQSLSQSADRLYHQSAVDAGRHALTVGHTEGEGVDAGYLHVVHASVDA